jgi:competence protein ComEA
VAVTITPGERKALLFLTSLLALGAATRFVSALRHEQSIAALGDSTRLTAQIAAVDSARARSRAVRQARAKAPPRPRPSARARSAAAQRRDSVVIIDVDRANAAELELLPRVGPALAQRIVSNREEFGPFGSLEALSRVKGIGPKLVTRLAAHVTFSGSVRPSRALSVSPGSTPTSGRPPPPG